MKNRTNKDLNVSKQRTSSKFSTKAPDKIGSLPTQLMFENHKRFLINQQASISSQQHISDLFATNRILKTSPVNSNQS